MTNVKNLSDQLKRIAYEKGLSPAEIAKKSGLNIDFVVATLEGFPLAPISHVIKISNAIGCKLLAFG